MDPKVKKRTRKKKLECINGLLSTASLTDGPCIIPIGESMDLMIVDLLSEHQWTEPFLVVIGMASPYRIGPRRPELIKDTISEWIASVSLMMVSGSLSYGVESRKSSDIC